MLKNVKILEKGSILNIASYFNFWNLNKYNELAYYFYGQENYCCNLSGSVALIVWFTTNGMCAKNKNICMWCKQATTKWSRQV